MQYHFHDFIGNIGVLFVVFSYLLLQLGKLSGTSATYSILNIIGAVMILYSLYFNFNLSSVIIECVWILISTIGIFRYFRNRKQFRSHSTGEA